MEQNSNENLQLVDFNLKKEATDGLGFNLYSSEISTRNILIDEQ